MQRVEQPTDVAQESENVDDEDHVEGSPRLRKGRGFACVALEEVEILVALARRRHGLAGEVDPHAEGGRDRGEQVARAAADLEDSLSRRHPRPEHPVEVAVVVRTLLPSLRLLLVVRFVEGPDLVPGAPR